MADRGTGTTLPRDSGSLFPSRPPEPPNEHDGFHYIVSFEDHLDWHVPAMTEKGCRFLLSNPRRSCGRPAVASLRRGKAGWWNYCDQHLYGRWIEDGKIAHWRLVKDET